MPETILVANIPGSVSFEKVTIAVVIQTSGYGPASAQTVVRAPMAACVDQVSLRCCRSTLDSLSFPVEVRYTLVLRP